MNTLNLEIEQFLRSENVDFVHFINISRLNKQQNRGLPYAILIGIAINSQFIKGVSDNPHYIHSTTDEYAQTEELVGSITDKLANLLILNGFKAISQSDTGLIAENTFDFSAKTSILPHKTIAMLSGLGYIGKNNLFITTKYGAAQCLGTVLTNAPLLVKEHKIQSPKCYNCNICRNVCPKKSLRGISWNINISRDEIINVYNCTACLKCMVYCPKTQAYVSY